MDGAAVTARINACPDTNHLTRITLAADDARAETTLHHGLLAASCSKSKEESDMRKRILFVAGSVVLLLGGYVAGTHNSRVAYAGQQTPDYTRTETHGTVPKAYGKLVSVIADSIGTGLVFEDADGVIRFVSVTGMKEGELARYDQTPVQGGIPKSYGHLVSAVVNHGQTGLVFEDAKGVIRFVTMTGSTEAELTRQ
jgi:hypothetical protein